MIKDFLLTMSSLFGWTKSILPIGKRRFLITMIIMCIVLLFSIPFCICWGSIIALGLFVFAVFNAFFFRDPNRDYEFEDNIIISPADGKIMSIKTEGDKNIVVIRIFLSVFDVHIQRAPISGTVKEIVYTKGKFLFANNKDADKNERNMIKFSGDTNDDQFAYVEQITGAIARRIKCFVQKEDNIKTGQKIGFIYFGSQVALYLPSDRVEIFAKIGQSVQGGITTLALWK